MKPGETRKYEERQRGAALADAGLPPKIDLVHEYLPCGHTLRETTFEGAWRPMYCNC